MTNSTISPADRRSPLYHLICATILLSLRGRMRLAAKLTPIILTLLKERRTR
jgi:hypothetical protein